MEVIILESPQQVAEKSALYIKNKIQAQSKTVLGLATGSTPILMYKELVKMYKDGKIDFSTVTSFNLDEYVGLDSEHEASYYAYMKKNLFSQVNIKEDNIFIPKGNAENIPQECQSYEQKIKDVGGIDLQVLGIGRDGHIGFNEPSSSLSSRTRLKTLTEQTRADNAPYFDAISEVPFHVLTMGVGTIMDAKHIILLACGEKKSQAIADCVEGPVTAMVPASVLQFHNKVTILIDEKAASKLKRQDYYRWVYRQKPEWQIGF